MPWWKRSLIRVAAAIAVLIGTIVLYVVRKTYGELYTFAGFVTLCAAGLIVAFWWERRKRQ